MNIHELSHYLNVPRDIVIVSHRNPDGDAVGSSLALGRLLRKAGHTVQMIMPSEFPHLQLDAGHRSGLDL